jgi:hypothetical protein
MAYPVGSLAAFPRPSRVSGKRLWCDRLPCGHIVAELPDGSLLLCTLKRRHKRPCFNPKLCPRKPRANSGGLPK